MNLLNTAATAIILCATAAPPALASMCVAYPPADFAELNWGTAEHYDGYLGGRILAAMQVIDGRAVIDLDLVGVPKLDALYAMEVGKQVLIIRVRGTLVCADDPVSRELFESAKFWVLPGDA